MDDGVSLESEVAKFEFTVAAGTETFDFTIKQTRPAKRREVKEETIGVIKVFWASHFGYDKLTAATTESSFNIQDKQDGKIKKVRVLDDIKYDAV